MPYFLNTSNCDISYMGYTVKAGTVGYIDGNPLDVRLVPVQQPKVNEDVQSKPTPVKKRKRKQAQASEHASSSMDVKPGEDVQTASNSAEHLQSDNATSTQESVQLDEVQPQQ